MKKGDRVLCKKTLLYNSAFDNMDRQFRKNKFYTIHEILPIHEIKYCELFILCENFDNLINQGLWFSEGCSSAFLKYPFEKYFYTEKEIRKMKLEKLNGKN